MIRLRTFYWQPLLLLLLVCATSYQSSAQKAPDHLEPPFWWAGMAHDSLQLMVHAKDAADTRVELHYEGVTLTGTHRTANPNYLWLDLLLADDVKPGTFPIIFKKGRKEVYRYRYELKEREAGSAARQGYGTEDVIYLITPDRFANGDVENDEVKALGDTLNRNKLLNRHGGDIQGVIDHLDYIDEMGYTAIWLNPVLENHQPAYSYHGYSTTDYYKIDPRFGTNALYKELGDKAGELGVLLIMDVILNHIGDGHWWMKDLPDANWLNYQDGYKITQHSREALQDPYGSQYDANLHASGWFVPSMPDLNQRNPLMATYLIQNTIWWTEFAGLGGIRVDTYSYPDKAFLTEWTRRMMLEYPNFNIVGEEWSVDPNIVSYWQRDQERSDGYVSYLPGVFDFPLQEALVKGLKESDLSLIYRTLGYDRLYPHPEDLVIFPDNHDMSRIFTQLDYDTALWRQAMAFILTTRGIPQIYYGTEILMANPNSKDHGEIRGDYPGGWPDDKTSAFTGEDMPTYAMEARAYMKNLLNWRKTAEVIHNGKLLHFAPTDTVYTYFRYTGEKKVMVVLNALNDDKLLDLSRFEEILGEGGMARDVISGRTYDLSGTSIMLKPKEPLILVLD